MDDIAKKLNYAIKTNNEIIGRHKYHHLKSLDILSVEEQKQVEAYETKRGKPATQADQDKINAYFKKVCEPEKESVYNFEPAELLELFINLFTKYKIKDGSELVRNNETKENILPLIYYFTRDNRFFNCKNVRADKFNYNGKIKHSEPSFDKGLLIIGNYGNGKTSTMDVFKHIFLRYDNLKFKRYISNDVVEMYELCDSPEAKYAFWNKMNKDVVHFDDIKGERMASNYGKANLFKDILEKREIKNLKTHITCNFKDTNPGDVKIGLSEFGEKYGSRVFDRIFSMFNIVEFKGSSFRK